MELIVSCSDARFNFDQCGSISCRWRYWSRMIDCHIIYNSDLFYEQQNVTFSSVIGAAL